MATDVYGLVGYPLGHSFSRDFFNRKFAAEDLDAEYVNFEIPTIDDLDKVLTTPGLRGFNVTIPYKQAIIPRLTRLDEIASAVGAVNVVRVERDGTLTGSNSDVYGFVESLRPLLVGGTHRRALVLGTGGASRAVVAGLRMLGIETTLVSRRRSGGTLCYEDITDTIVADHTVVVNATPLGMYPNVDALPDIPYSAMDARHIAFDLVYNPAETAFMRRAAVSGAIVKNGLEMLHLQALRAWQIWSGTGSICCPESLFGS